MKQPRTAVKELREVLDSKYDENIINLICDLEIQQQEYASCIELLEKQGKSQFPLDIETKRGYCLARLGRLPEADSCFERLAGQSVQFYDDLFLLTGNLYMDLDQHENALKFLEPLLSIPSHSKPSLWFKCGKLYYEIHDFQAAEEAFLSVVESQENSLATQAKLFLSKIYKNLGDVEKSISVLKTKSVEIEENFEISDEVICEMVSNAKLKIEESWIKQDMEELQRFLNYLVEMQIKLEVKKREDLVLGVGVNVLHQTFVGLIGFLMEKERFGECKEFIVKLLKIGMYRDERRKEMKMLLSSACVRDQDYDQAINAFKYICEKEGSDSNWITMAALMRKAEKPQLRSWLCKLLTKSPDSYPVHMLLGNSYFQTGNYSLAIKQYLQVYSPDDPMMNLQLGLSYLFSLCSRSLQKKEETFEKAFKYLKFYVKYRKKVNYFEAYFNLARAYHHILFFAEASKYYEKILRADARNSLYGGSVAGNIVVMAVKNLAVIRSHLDDQVGANRILEEWGVNY
jgi:general transcription factor 3C polypeptide 3 (transcription factor C subunit 4)